MKSKYNTINDGWMYFKRNIDLRVKLSRTMVKSNTSNNQFEFFEQNHYFPS